MSACIERGPGWELRLGDYREVLCDVTADAVITDPPYSERTHDGQMAIGGRRDLSYSSWTRDDVREFTEWGDVVCTGWVASLTDHVLAPEFEESARFAGRYAFAPLPAVERGRSVRLTGDGPSSWTSWLMVSRPRTQDFARWGTLPGAYVVSGGPKGERHIGGKPLAMMRAIVRDYSRPGDLVVDPCAGGGTTLLAAIQSGRRAIGAELDPETFEMAVARLRRARTLTIPGMEDTR